MPVDYTWTNQIRIRIIGPLAPTCLPQFTALERVGGGTVLRRRGSMLWWGTSHLPATLPSQCPMESCMHRRDIIILCWLMFSEGISLHCFQKLIATCLPIVLFKFPPEMPPNAEKILLVWGVAQRNLLKKKILLKFCILSWKVWWPLNSNL